MRYNRKWTDEEINLLKINPDLNYDKLLIMFPNYNKRAIVSKRYALQIGKYNRKWNKEEKDYLKQNYNHNNAKEISEKLNRPISSIFHFAGKLGISDRHHNITDEQKNHLIEITTKQWQNQPHPKGMLGKYHTEEVKAKIKKSSEKVWENPNYILNSEKHKQECSDRMTLLQYKRIQLGIPMGGYRYRKHSQGKRIDLNNQYFRSSWEANIARYFNFTKVKWIYEYKTFWFEKIKRGTRSYTPDFYLPNENRYVEVKGWMDNRSKTKLKRMSQYYPEIKIELIEQKEYNSIKKWKSLIPNWE